MADRAKFADAVLTRFAGGDAASVDAPDDDAPAPVDADAENGRMLAAAVKRGDGAAICEAVRRITGS